MVGLRKLFTVSPEQTLDRTQQEQPKPEDNDGDDLVDISIEDGVGTGATTRQAEASSPETRQAEASSPETRQAARASLKNTPCWRRYLKWIVFATVVVIGVSVGLSLTVLGTANPFAYFVQNDPPGLTAATPWETQGHSGLQINVMNALEDRWTPTFDRYVQEWDNGDPDALTLSTTRVARDIDCTPVNGHIKVCNGDYGNTDWRGINITEKQNGWAVNSAMKLNDYHLNNESEDWKLYTMCHELGHGFGLAHTDEDYYNKNRGDCLDYTLRPGSNLHPGKYNFDLLAQLYGTVNGGTGTRRLGDPGKALVPCEKDAEELQLSLPSFIQESYASVVSKLEVMSCEELSAGQSGQNVRMLHQHKQGEGCEVELGYDGANAYSIQVHKLLAA